MLAGSEITYGGIDGKPEFLLYTCALFHGNLSWLKEVVDFVWLTDMVLLEVQFPLTQWEIHYCTGTVVAEHHGIKEHIYPGTPPDIDP